MVVCEYRRRPRVTRLPRSSAPPARSGLRRQSQTPPARRHTSMSTASRWLFRAARGCCTAVRVARCWRGAVTCNMPSRHICRSEPVLRCSARRAAQDNTALRVCLVIQICAYMCRTLSHAVQNALPITPFSLCAAAYIQTRLVQCRPARGSRCSPPVRSGCRTYRRCCCGRSPTASAPSGRSLRFVSNVSVDVSYHDGTCIQEQHATYSIDSLLKQWLCLRNGLPLSCEWRRTSNLCPLQADAAIMVRIDVIIPVHLSYEAVVTCRRSPCCAASCCSCCRGCAGRCTRSAANCCPTWQRCSASRRSS